MVGMSEFTDEPGKSFGLCHQTDMARPVHPYVLDARNELRIPLRHVHRNHPVQMLFAGDDERGRLNAAAIPLEVDAFLLPNSQRHQARDRRCAQNAERVRDSEART